MAFEHVLSLAEYPVLESHVLDGRPVLPLALDAGMVGPRRPYENAGLMFHGCDDLRVLHGVVLDEDAPPTLRVLAGKAAKKDGFYRTPVELRGVRGDGRETLYAKAEIVLASDLPPAPPRAAVAARPLHSFTPEEIYRRVLFHGPDMQCIESVEACDDRGVVARLRAAPIPAEWVRRPLRQKWIADPLVVDGGFQMMILWSVAHNGVAGLPCHVARYRQYRRAFPAEGGRVSLEIIKAAELHALGDLDFLAADGQVIVAWKAPNALSTPASNARTGATHCRSRRPIRCKFLVPRRAWEPSGATLCVASRLGSALTLSGRRASGRRSHAERGNEVGSKPRRFAVDAPVLGADILAGLGVHPNRMRVALVRPHDNMPHRS